MNALRTYAFRFAFYALSVPVVLAGPLAIPFGRRAVQRYAPGWARMHPSPARALLGLRARVAGALSGRPAPYAPPATASYVHVHRDATALVEADRCPKTR